MFSNKVAQLHPINLFDIQSVTLDIAKHAKVLVPNLALNFGQPLSTTASGVGVPGEHLDCSNVYAEVQLAPLFVMLGKLHCLVDDRIHLAQAAETTKVGDNAYYDHKLASIQWLANHSGTRANREFWVHNQTDTEKEILKLKAHEKQLA